MAMTHNFFFLGFLFFFLLSPCKATCTLAATVAPAAHLANVSEPATSFSLLLLKSLVTLIESRGG